MNRKLFINSRSALFFILNTAILLFANSDLVVAQTTCTVSGAGNVNWPPTCQEAGVNTGNATIIRIPAGVTLNFNDNGDTWTGTRFDVLGTLYVTTSGQVTLNSNIVVKNGGTLRIDSKLNLGSTSGCGRTLILETGSTADIVGGSSDRLTICGNEIARGSGGGGCNPYPAGPTPYCEPAAGFTGPVGFDQNGINTGLPVDLLYFKGSATLDAVSLTWATATEKNAAFFTVERSNNGKDFTVLGIIDAYGNSHAPRAYNLTDANPTIGNTYYRLLETDLSGDVQYFNIISVQFAGQKRVIVHPNPVEESDLITIEKNFFTDDEAHVTINDVSGHEVANFTFSGSTAQPQFRLRSGTYFLTLRTGKDQYTTRFVIK